MALTNYGLLTEHQLKVWSGDMWHAARNKSFIGRFMGNGANSVIQRITDLKKSQKGVQAVITLLADLEGDGVAGDRQLKGNEEAGKSYDQVIRIDQLRHAVSHEGRMADQKSVVKWREQAKDALAYYLADRIDQLAFLTMSGVSYAMRNNGAARVGSDLPFLDYAADVRAPTNLRKLRWDGTNKVLVPNGATSAITTADTPMWEAFVQAKAYAKDQYIRPVSGAGAEEVYHAFLTPQAMARLKLDPTYMQNIRHAQKRSESNPLFTGSSVEIDGIAIHEFRHVYNTAGAASGSKWGSGSTVDGCQMLFCGAQSLGFADIGAALWEEEQDDFGNRQALATGKIFGFLKPQFVSQYAGNTLQDFGVTSIYFAQ